MKTLIVLAHPLSDSLNAHLAGQIAEKAKGLGHLVTLRDLYREGFEPQLTPEERQGYYRTPFDDAAQLAEVECLVLVFPTWWFGLPAILKGWIDRSFLPGVAYDHATDLSALTPRLTRLRHVMAVTTLGSPGWIDWLVLRRPVRQMLKWGLTKACAPQARFHMLSLYKAETVAQARADRFLSRINRRLEQMK